MYNVNTIYLYFRFLGKLLWQHREDAAIFGKQPFCCSNHFLLILAIFLPFWAHNHQYAFYWRTVSEINITSWRSCLPLTLLCSFLHWFWDDTLCRSLCSLTLFSCVNILSYILATKLTSLPSQIKRGQNHWLSLPTTQHQKTCKD